MRGRRLGLRARVITAFAVSALLLSVLLSVVTFSLTRANLIEAREEDALTSAETNALTINSELSESTDIAQLVGLMTSVVTPTDTLQGMIYANRGYYVDTFRFTDPDVNPEFRESLLGSKPARMTYNIGDEPHFVVGLPLPGAQANAYYIQAAPLTDVEQALNSLLPTLAGAATITTILGMAFGVYVTKRILTPINEISDAAGLIAAGDLSTRLESGGDPDLDQLIWLDN